MLCRLLGATAAQKVKMQQLGTWRTSKLIGLNVYNSNNEKIGDINELINEASGKLNVVVIGVGGFLGVGERNVGLPWNQVKFLMEPRPASTASTSTTRTTTTEAAVPAETATTTTTTTTTTTKNREYPDHAVVNMTKDQRIAGVQISERRQQHHDAHLAGSDSGSGSGSGSLRRPRHTSENQPARPAGSSRS